MGMFDSYSQSREFNCPKCGLKHMGDFQTKSLINCLALFKLGDVIDPSMRYVDFYSHCEGMYKRHDYDKPKNEKGEYEIIEPNCIDGTFWCRVFLDESGKAIKERVTWQEDKENAE